MIEIKEKKDCCGCNACVQRCPKHCISMSEDSEGFLYPSVDVSLCINCGLCEKVCPVINRHGASAPLKVFAAKNPDVEERELSSSGGLFIRLARQVIADGGVVFGVVFDENWQARHVAAETTDGLIPMMRSKYVQSNTGKTFAEAERFLRAGRKVMYVGTSCQISGLRFFLRKDYPNLLAVDVICHGVPSPGVWRKYLDEFRSGAAITARSAAAGKNTVLESSLKPLPVITGISFREKHRSGYGWKKFGFVVWGKSVSKTDKNSVLSSYLFSNNPFMRGFLANIYLRPSCYHCPVKGGTSGADITIADYWGIERVLPDYDDDSGVGLAIVHTDKGLAAFDHAGFDRRETTLDDATVCNKSYWHPVGIPKCRPDFFELLKGNTVEQAVTMCLHVPLCRRVFIRSKRMVRKVVKRLINLH